MATTKLPRQMLTGNLFTSLSSSATTVLDFSGGWTIGVLDGLAINTTVSTTSLAAGSSYALRIKDNGVSRTLTFPGTWTWLTTPPAATTVSKWVLITLECLNADTPVILADWKLADTAATLAEYQPLDSDLTAIAALSTTTHGRSLLTGADAAASRTTLGLGTAALVADSSLVHIAGTETITGTKIFDLNSTSPIPAAIGTRVLVTASTTVADIEQFNIGGGASSLRGRSAGGTWAALAGTPDGAFFSSFAGHGHDGTNWETGGSCAYYALVADGVHSGTNKGSWHQWAGTPNGSLVRAEWMRLQGGLLGVGTNPTAGNGLLQLASGTTRANGIAFGTDTFLFRPSAAILTLGDLAGAGKTGFLLQNTGASAASYASIDFSSDGSATGTIFSASSAAAGSYDKFNIGTITAHGVSIITTNARRLRIGTAGEYHFSGGTPVAIPTGFGTPTGVSRLSNFPGATATLGQTSGALADLITLLKAFGLVAA